MASYNLSHTGQQLDAAVEKYLQTDFNSFVDSATLNNYVTTTTLNNYVTTAVLNNYVAKTELLDLVYPVGAIYISINHVSPASLFGGTWEQIQDKFLLSAGSTYTAGDTGGAANHTHGYAHTHTTPATTTGSHTLTVAEIPSHRHQEYYTWSGAGNVGGNWKVNMTSTANGGAGTWTHTSGLTDVGAVGGGGGHTHSQVATTTDSQSTSTTDSSSSLPPYLVVYMWKRTA